MTKHRKRVVFFLICTMMLMITACEQKKSYATLEEWYADNPLPESEIHSTFYAGSLSGKMDIIIEENELIYKCTMSKKIFGEDEKMDELYTKVIENTFSQQKDEFNKIINDISVISGIDASQISLRYEYYNPGDPVPFYSQSFGKNFF